MPSWDVRISLTGLTGVEIMPVCGHWDAKEDWCGVLLGLVLFILVVPPLQPRWEGLYVVWSI
jgi:hypothetical protein